MIKLSYVVYVLSIVSGMAFLNTSAMAQELTAPRPLQATDIYNPDAVCRECGLFTHRDFDKEIARLKKVKEAALVEGMSGHRISNQRAGELNQKILISEVQILKIQLRAQKLKNQKLASDAINCTANGSPSITTSLVSPELQRDSDDGVNLHNANFMPDSMGISELK